MTQCATFESRLVDRGISPELFLLNAVEMANGDDGAEALEYLRSKAVSGDIEAKVKISTVLKDRSSRESQCEAEIWARSIFDRRLSKALGHHVEKTATFLTNTNDPNEAQNDSLDPEGWHLAGRAYLDGIGLAPHLEHGLVCLDKAVQVGHSQAKVELAAILGDQFKYPDVHNMERSVQLYQDCCVSDNSRRLTAADARAQADLARVYYEGSDTVKRDLDKAYEYARRVAEATGEPYCQYIVGDVLLNRDPRQAVFWLTQAGEQGFPLAIEALSRVYFQGWKSVKQDYELAHEWCVKGDDIWPSGLGYCQTCLGDMYRAGLGVPRDTLRSFEYYQKAASQQDAPQNYARYMLGEMFFKGERWPQNYAVAAEYYKLAAVQGYVPARERLQELEKHTKPEATPPPSPPASTTRKSAGWKIWSYFSSGRRKQAEQQHAAATAAQ